MKKTIKRILYTILAVLALVVLVALVLAYWPVESKVTNKGISPETAALLRDQYKGTHNEFKTDDGLIHFLRRWDPPQIDSTKKDIAVLIFHGITAYSGPYNMAGVPISEGGYTVFGLDYRGHGLSDGNRGDSPGKDRWIADLSESVAFIKSLGFKKVIVLGHSLGVASAICVANAVPDEIAGVILLSGAYEGRKGLNKPISFFEKARLLSSAIFRPSYRAAEYYRDGMTGSTDTLFNFRYTVRFLTMMDVKKLRLPEKLQVPILVGVGDRDELFEVEKVKELYNLIPSKQKEFFIMKDATHAKIPRESWDEIVLWLNKNYSNN